MTIMLKGFGEKLLLMVRQKSALSLSMFSVGTKAGINMPNSHDGIDVIFVTKDKKEVYVSDSIKDTLNLELKEVLVVTKKVYRTSRIANENLDGSPFVIAFFFVVLFLFKTRNKCVEYAVVLYQDDLF